VVRLLRPPYELEDDEEFDSLVDALDGSLDHADRALRGKNGYRPSQAVEPLADVRASVEALARDDVDAARAVWTSESR
jgi:hypothetical protein